MSELPSSWARAAMGDICAQPTQRVPSVDEDFTYIDIASVDRDRKSILEPQRLPGAEAPSRARKVVEEGDVIVSMTRPNLNAVALVGAEHNECIASTGFDVLKPIEVEPRWIFAAVRSAQFVDAMCDKVQGALYPAVKSADIREHEIPLPPLAEQTRIAQKLDELLAQVDTLKARTDSIPALLKRFRQSVLSSAVSGRLTEEWRKSNDHAVDITNAAKIHQSEWLAAREREYQRKQKGYCENTILRKFKPAPFLEDVNLPPSWLTTSLSNLAEVTDPNPSHRMPKYTDTGTPFISTENFGNNGQIDFSIGKKVTKEELEAQRARYEIQEGTFAFTRIGTIGRSVFLPSPHNYCISHAVAVVQPYTKLTAPKFLKLVASAPSTLSQATEGVQSVGVPDLGVGKMKSFKIPMPPIDEQVEIVRRVEQLFAFSDQLEAKVASAKSRIDHLTQSILAKAFRGELVPQDPNDEPASVLVERIKAQRAVAPKAKRARKDA